MQLLLGVHGLLGFALFAWALGVRRGDSYDFLFPGSPGLGPGLLVVAWCFAWWVIARLRPMQPWQNQPASRFHSLPAVVALGVQVAVCLVLGNTHSHGGIWTESIPWLELALLICVPFVMASWAFAGIRFDAGTWAAAWGIWILGLVGAFSVMTRGWANC